MNKRRRYKAKALRAQRARESLCRHRWFSESYGVSCCPDCGARNYASEQELAEMRAEREAFLADRSNRCSIDRAASHL